MVRVTVNYVRDSFSELLRGAHHYSMLMTFVSATAGNNIEPNIQVHIIVVWCATAYMTPKD